jgi:hypothetical protein
MQHKMADIKKQQNFPNEVGIEYLIQVNAVCKVLAVIPSTWVVSWRDFRFLQSLSKKDFPELLL